jgi:hypothetical protein
VRAMRPSARRSFEAYRDEQSQSHSNMPTVGSRTRAAGVTLRSYYRAVKGREPVTKM